MKEGLEYKTLGDIVTFTRGLTYKKSDEVEFSTKVVLRSTNIDVDNNSLNIDELKYLNENIEFEEEKLIRKGSILMCMSNGSKKHLGKVALIEHEYKYAFGGFMGLLTPVINIDSKYLYYTLTTPKYKKYINSLSEGANINNLKIKDIQNYIIPFFPIDQQRRIVSYLDSSFQLIDEIKEKAQKSLSEAKALFQSALAEAMEPKEGWEEKKLNEVSNYSIGLTYKPSDVSNKGTIVLRSTNIQRDQLDLNDIVRVNATIKESLFVKIGDILMCSRNGSSKLVGKVAIIDKLDEPMTFGTFMMIIRSQYNDYLFHYFKSDGFRNQIKHGESNMINQITRYMLNDVVLSIPPLSTQKRIVSHLNKLSSNVKQMEERYQKIVEECDALKQAMLRDVFE